MNEQEIYGRFLKIFRHGTSVGEVRQGLEQLQHSQEADNLSVKDILELQVYAFRTLQDITFGDPGEAKDLILTYLLSLCLATHPDAGVQLSQLRECLRDWLNQYPEATRHDLREEILEYLHPHLASSDPRAACWVVSHIGYRTDRVVDALWNIVWQNDDDIGDIALATLTTLGVPDEQRECALDELHKRVANRYNRRLVSALARLADPTSIDVIWEHWLLGRDDLEQVDHSLLLHVFSTILDAQSEDAELQDRAWQMLIALAKTEQKGLPSDFYLGPIVPTCNSMGVVPTMLAWVAQEDEEKPNPAWGRYLIGLRLEESVRPRQLDGWREPPSSETIASLRRDACKNTEQDLSVRTHETSEKEQAWETALRTGYSGVFDWFEEGVAAETGRFLQQHIIELLACFHTEPLPELVLKWVTEPHDEPRGEADSREFARRMAAVRMAHSTASRQAFEALLNFGFTVDGDAIMQSLDALAEVATCLASDGDLSIVADLVEAIIDREERHQRAAAAYALARVAPLAGSALVEHAERLIPPLHDETRQPYERGELIITLGCIENWKIPDSLVQDLEKWALEPDRWLGGSALDALIRRGCLHESHTLLVEALGLEQTDDGWDLSPERERFDWAPYFIGWLYHDHPRLFLPAIVSILQSGRWQDVVQIISWLHRSHAGSGKIPFPNEASDATIRRILERQTRGYGETQLFDMMADLAPDRLASEQWQTVWEDWLPDSRVALADALGGAALKSSYHDNAVLQLQLLARDGQYPVRRAAYRGLARQSTEALYALCLTWANKDSTTELRLRAAEACGWLEEEEPFEELYKGLAVDSEREVREAARRSREERRERAWAQKYLSVAIGVMDESSQAILSAWSYGDALMRIGDDSCINALQEHREKVKLPHLRYWIERIIKRMEDNWRKTTQKWPEPWFTWQGSIEKGRGKAEISRDEMIDIQYSIWRQSPSSPDEVEAWGGAIWDIPMRQNLDDIVIELEDGRRGEITIRRITAKNMFAGGVAVFVGQGLYPA